MTDLDWRDGGVPVSRRFDDPYFSLQDGWAETAHVFLAGNGLPARFRPGFAIAETGFGTGLNLMAARIAWAASGTPGPLTYTAFEAFPLSAEQTAAALAAFPQALAVAGPVLEMLRAGETRLETPGLRLRIILGDARQTLPAWDARADAWFLDGFAPAKNPELWDPALLAQVAAHTLPGGTFATYTAAGHVRRALADAGFAVARVPGYGRKRHMTRGTLPE